MVRASVEYGAWLSAKYRKENIRLMTLDRDHPELSEFGGEAWCEPYAGYGIRFEKHGLCKIGIGPMSRAEQHRGEVAYTVSGQRLTILEWERDALALSDVRPDKALAESLCPKRGYTEVRPIEVLVPALMLAYDMGLEFQEYGLYEGEPEIPFEQPALLEAA